MRIEILCFNVQNKTELIRQVIEGLNHLIRDYVPRSHSQEMLVNQLKSYGIELMYALEDRDVVVWILCKSPNAIQQLQDMNKSKSLLDIFCHLCHFNEEKFQVLKPKHINVDYDHMKKEFGNFSFK